MMKARARDLGIRIGHGLPGPLNAITDVAGVRVGHSDVRQTLAGHREAHTGVTVVQPRASLARNSPCFAGVHVLNGNGDATGFEWIREAGLLTTPIGITNTHSVGLVRDALIRAEHEALPNDESMYWCMPVVMETYDGLLNDINGFHVQAQHVQQALASARGGLPAEGGVGGGSGMVCHEFKGGIGTASRRLGSNAGAWTVGALVQANHGKRQSLVVQGYPVGRNIPHEVVASPFKSHALPHPGMGSIVVVLATDAPLLPHQCRRLAQRASLGIARSGGGTEDSSGDIFLAFSTGNSNLPVTNYAKQGPLITSINMLNLDHISPLFEAAAEAVEEAIVNALVAGSDVVGNLGNRVHALPHERLFSAMRSYGWQPH